MTRKLNRDVTFFEALQWASLCIKEKKVESNDVQFLLLNQMDWDFTTLLRNYRAKMTDDERVTFEKQVNRLIAGEPAQYISGKTNFYGYPLQVNQNVLIPRPETEELVEWILQDYDEQPRKILDVGTGSGAIAIALKKQRPNWKVTASDISEAALEVAKANAQLNQVQINFVYSDLLTAFNGENFDVIVSNPPYISKKEEDLMDQTVLDYEPSLALFADHEGLLLYEQLAQTVGEHLRNGALYLEIGFQQGKAVTGLLANQFPKAKIVLRQDLAQHDRMIKMDLKEGK